MLIFDGVVKSYINSLYYHYTYIRIFPFVSVCMCVELWSVYIYVHLWLRVCIWCTYVHVFLSRFLYLTVLRSLFGFIVWRVLLTLLSNYLLSHFVFFVLFYFIWVLVFSWHASHHLWSLFPWFLLLSLLHYFFLNCMPLAPYMTEESVDSNSIAIPRKNTNKSKSIVVASEQYCELP